MSRPNRAYRGRRGFTLVELMIVVAIIAVVSTLAIPRLSSANVAARESNAISALRSIASAQAQIHSQGAIDSNADGAGEYASFGELTGAMPLRVTVGGAPAPGQAGVDELRAPVLSQVFSRVDANSVVTHSGYVFKIYLPTAGAVSAGIPEEPGGGFPAGPFPDPGNSTFLWCAYAWPYDAEVTGNRCFFVNQEGEILASTNRGTGGAPVYDGLAQAGHPPFDAALTAADMSADTASGTIGNDGNIWAPVN